MKRLSLLLAAGALATLPVIVMADEANIAFGGDQYSAGQNVTVESPVANDVFAAGYDVSLVAPVGGDAHLAGFNVTSGASVGGDLYAGGYNVNINQAVGGDISAVGNSITVRTPQPVPGNLRLAGQTVTVGSAVDGSAIITAQTLTLDAPIQGDLRFFGENLVFGPGARVSGMLSVHAPKAPGIPDTVASADRVRFEQLVHPDYVGEAGKTAQNVVSGFWPAVWAAAAWFALLLAIGAAFIALMPRGVAAMRLVSEKRPFRRIGLGILAFSATIGLVPVFVITLIGILLLPVVFVVVGIACSLAYLAGVYFAGHRLATAFVSVETNLHRLAVLAASLVVAALVGMIPVLGWLMTLLLLVFGFGVATAVIMVRWSSGDAARLAQAPSPGVGAAPSAA